MRFFFNNTEKVSCDKQGRVLLAGHLKEYASLKKDVVFGGAVQTDWYYDK